MPASPRLQPGTIAANGHNSGESGTGYGGSTGHGDGGGGSCSGGIPVQPDTPGFGDTPATNAPGRRVPGRRRWRGAAGRITP